MKTWTTPAERRLDEYLAERVAREALDGADAAELKEDLRRHVYEEAERRPDPSIGLMQLETILGSLDGGYRPPPPPALPRSKRRTGLMWTFGVILPALVLLLELVSSFCGGVFFNPVPTWWHVLLVALVPAVNAWLLTGACHGTDRAKGAAAGAALVIACFYALLFLPLIHWSLFALIFFGLGIVSLTPILAALASWKVGRDIRAGSAGPATFRIGWRLGAAAAVLALGILEAPAIWTRVNLAQAVSGKENQATAIERLRMWHSERSLLAACYESGGFDAGATRDITDWIGGAAWVAAFGGNVRVDPSTIDSRREIFFRVTGRPFTSVPPPAALARRSGGRGGVMNEWEFDDHLGGDEVAVRLRHLDLKESRFDGHLDSASAIGYGEWTMVFRNQAANAQEARCLVKLPPGGRVSRLTLWVEGEPREAAFSSVSKVKAAYKEVAVQQRRDPVLVTVAGLDTVLVQCFPVPARGEMKIRFGVTAPLDGLRWELPKIVERNFGSTASLEHVVWLQGDHGFQLSGGGDALAAAPDGNGRSLLAALPPDVAMGRGLAVVSEPLAGEPEVVWCEDRFAAESEKFLLREPRRLRTEGSGKVVLVIDGSAAMAGTGGWLAAALSERTIALLADDTARRVDARELARHRFTGGRDNEPALREALRISREHGGLPVVWVHGPQAAEVSRAEALLQMLERGAVLPVIYAVEAVPGPNRLAQALRGPGALRRGPEPGPGGEGFGDFLNGLLDGRDHSGWTWSRAATPPAEGKRVWDQLARLWAMETAEDSRMLVEDEAMRPQIAARYQLVTRVSGAVVLETMEQFARHGLTPVDADAVPHLPSVPEPSSALLLLVSAAAALLRRQR
jgi:hypothetical protein